MSSEPSSSTHKAVEDDPEATAKSSEDPSATAAAAKDADSSSTSKPSSSSKHTDPSKKKKASSHSKSVLAESKELLDDDLQDAILASLEQETKGTTASTTRNTTTSNNNRETVSVERKEQLLLEARVSRLQWIHRVPLPYRQSESPDDPWVQHEELAKFLNTCHAAALMPSTTKVLSHLYGLEEQRVTAEDVANRLQSVLGSLDDDTDAPQRFVKPGQQLLEAEIAKQHPENNDILTGYRDFWLKLQTPECASLVQAMRTGVRNLNNHEGTAEELADRLKSYLEGMFESLKAHAGWKKEAVNDRVKHSLESFVYGQCFTLLQSTLWTEEAQKNEKEWNDRLAALQFVTPTHLDIPCLAGADIHLEEELAEPIKAIATVDLYYSAYEKLQRVLAVYHGVNSALTHALNKAKKEGESEKLPSADDVLPTIILTVLRARPARILVNLRMMELFCPPEYLRGEAGYAFTNLYGAVQFLQDLDMKDPKSLSISKEEFKKGLDESRAKSRERLEIQKKRAQFQGPKIDTDISLQHVDIPAQEIRAARDRGETVDLNWALEWQREKIASEVIPTSAAGQSTSQERSSAAEDVLPSGFSRNYTFLTARPEDIRMSDLSQLLSEYRMLVHTTETLLGERASKLSAERKKKVNIVQEELLANARRVDPSLLPENHPSMSSP